MQRYRTLNRTCSVCNTPFYAAPCDVAQGKGRYCSWACYKSTLIDGRHIYTCPHCGKEKRKYPSQVNGKAVYCSKACHYAAQRKLVPTTCKTCGSTFHLAPHATKNYRYCSTECKPARVTRACRTCAVTFTATPSDIRRGGAIYCSKPCAWIGARKLSKEERISYRGVQWRKAVFARDAYTCQSCGKHGGPLNAHHVKAWKNHAHLRFSLDNGITLCIPCHATLHPNVNFYATTTPATSQQMD